MRTLLACLIATATWAGDAPQVGVIWNNASSKTDLTYAAFAKALAEKAPQIQVELKGKLKTLEEAGAVYAEWQGTKQAVVFLRSDGATWMKYHAPTVPSFFGVANDPVALGVLKDPAKPDGLITGCSYAVPAAAQVTAMKAIWPDLKSLGLLLQDGHPGALVDGPGTKAACAAAGIAYQERLVKSKDQVGLAVKELKDAGVGLIVMGTQGVIFDNAATIAQIAGDLPVWSYDEKPVNAGKAVCGLVADDAWLGAQLAGQVIAVLVDGKKIAEVPAVYDPKPRLKVHLARMTALKVVIPEELLQDAVKVE